MCIIIAEAGENHLGDMDLARKMIDVSREAGADYVKVQYYDAEACADSDPEKEWFRKVQLDMDQLRYLYGIARQRGIAFLCTPWDAAKAADLFSLGVRDMKIASFHITDHDLLKLVNDRADKVFLSTGMSSVAEIDAAVAMLKKVDLYLLHCVSEYPLPDERVNMRTMDYLRERYRCQVGYSDHTLGIVAPLVAVARGAAVIEKHITLSKTYFGTDHILSADPLELKMLVEYKRMIVSMLGTDEKTMTDAERQNQEFLRNRFSGRQ